MAEAITPHNPLEGDRPELTVNLHDGSEEQISIVIVHKDRPEYLNILLQSIAVTSANNNYEMIVVDNASGPASQAFLDEIEKEGVKVVRNEKNLYWSGACNRGVAAANKGSKYIVFLHCDVVVLHPGWLDLLINVSESQGSGMVGVELASYFMQNQKVEYIQEWCLLMTRACFEKVGPWPEELPLIGGSFILSMKAQQREQNPQVMRNPIAHHYKIFSIDINEYERLTEQAMITLPKVMQQVQSQPLKK